MAPGLSAATGLALLAGAQGEPGATVFNDCKRGLRGLLLMLSAASEDARNRGFCKLCRGWQPPWHEPRREDQEPFV